MSWKFRRVERIWFRFHPSGEICCFYCAQLLLSSTFSDLSLTPSPVNSSRRQETRQMMSHEEILLRRASACLNAAPAPSSASLLQDEHLEVLKLLMTAAESRSGQSRPHFLDAVCQSGSWPEQTGGPVRVLDTERRVGGREEEEDRREKKTDLEFLWQKKKEVFRSSSSPFSFCGRCRESSWSDRQRKRGRKWKHSHTCRETVQLRHWQRKKLPFLSFPSFSLSFVQVTKWRQEVHVRTRTLVHPPAAPPSALHSNTTLSSSSSVNFKHSGNIKRITSCAVEDPYPSETRMGDGFSLFLDADSGINNLVVRLNVSFILCWSWRSR